MDRAVEGLEALKSRMDTELTPRRLSSARQRIFFLAPTIQEKLDQGVESKDVVEWLACQPEDSRIVITAGTLRVYMAEWRRETQLQALLNGKSLPQTGTSLGTNTVRLVQPIPAGQKAVTSTAPGFVPPVAAKEL